MWCMMGPKGKWMLNQTIRTDVYVVFCVVVSGEGMCVCLRIVWTFDALGCLAFL